MHLTTLLAISTLLTAVACAPAALSSPTPVIDPTLGAATPSPTVPLTAGTATRIPSSTPFPSPTPIQSWQTAGSLEGGNVTTLAVSPSYRVDQTLFVGTRSNDRLNGFNGRLFFSRNGGQTWSRVGDGLPDLWIYSISVSPSFSEDRTLFIGMAYTSQEQEKRKYEGKVYKSVDGGSTWIEADHGLPGLMTGRLAVSPEYPKDQTVFATLTSDIRLEPASGGLYRSEDGGRTWKPSGSGLPANLPATAVVFSPNFAADGVMLTSTVYGSDAHGERDTVFKSTDRGRTWRVSNQGLPKGIQAGAFVLSPEFAKDRTAYLTVSMCCGDPRGAYKSTDGGENWTRAYDAALDQYVSALAISPRFPSDGTLFASTGSGGIYVSMDRGDSWRSFNRGLPATTTRALAVTATIPPVIFVAIEGHGVWRWVGMP